MSTFQISADPAPSAGASFALGTFTVLQGIPATPFLSPLSSIVLSGLPLERIPAAAGFSNFVRVFASAVGTSLATTGWNYRTILHHVRLAERTGVNNPAFTGY